MKNFDKNRRNFLIYSSLSTMIFFAGCDNKINLNARKVHFDRDICERCKMVVSVKNYVAQAVNPKDGKYYVFDDIGCAVNWFKENSIEWEKDAVIYVSDAKTEELIDAKKAFYKDGANSPMSYGFAAHKTEQSGTNFNYEYIKTKILESEDEKKKSMSHYKH